MDAPKYSLLLPFNGEIITIDTPRGYIPSQCSTSSCARTCVLPIHYRSVVCLNAAKETQSLYPSTGGAEETHSSGGAEEALIIEEGVGRARVALWVILLTVVM